MKVAIVAGGTGGHIYPGLAIAEAIKARDPQAEILFFGSSAGMEKQLVAQAGFPLKLVKAQALLRKLSFQAVFAPLVCLVGFFQSFVELKKFRPDKVLSTGGYVSLPVVLAAALLKLPIFLHEQNVLPGVVNRLCHRFAQRTFLSFPESLRYLSGKVVGNPVRQKILNISQKEPKLKRLILVMGGSQGARSINQKVLAAVDHLPDNVSVVHLLGQKNFNQEIAQKRSKNYQPLAYLDEIDKVLAETDLVFSRAGATAIAEFLAAQIPMVLVPFPYAAENHQLLNAQVVAATGAAKVILEQDFTPEVFLAVINESGQNYAKMKLACAKLAKPQAAKEIVDSLYVKS